MKTINPNDHHAADIVRGHTGRRAGGTIRVRDQSGTDVVVDTLVFTGTVVTEVDTGDGDEALVTLSTAGLLIPDSDIVITKDASNPTFNFACIPENVIKVGSTYYAPYTVSDTGDVRLATASDRDGPWTSGSVIFAEASVTWDVSAFLAAPYIVEVSGTYYLFYCMIVAGGATSSSNAIGYATSSSINGTYTDHGSAVFTPSTAGLWDSRQVGEPSVIYHGGQWIMAYMGQDSDIAHGQSEQVGVATATDPSGPWTRSANNPVVPFGSSGTFDDALIADPDIFYANGYYWIWYVGGIDAGPCTRAEEGLAYSATPAGPYTKHAQNPILTVGAGGAWDDVWVFRGSMYLEDGEWGGVYAGYDGANFKGGNFRLSIVSAGTDEPPRADDVPIDDTGGYFTGTEVETALQELGADVAALSSGTVGHYEIAVSGAAGPVLFTNDANSDHLYVFVPD